MKPITYWVQTPEINALCERFGSNLERLSPKGKTYLIYLCAYSLLVEEGEAFDDEASDAWMQLYSLEPKNHALLIEAIACQLNSQPQQKGEAANFPS